MAQYWSHPFPAGAGMNRRGSLCQVPNVTVPRRRGDEPAFTTTQTGTGLRSPQARG